MRECGRLSLDFASRTLLNLYQFLGNQFTSENFTENLLIFVNDKKLSCKYEKVMTCSTNQNTSAVNLVFANQSFPAVDHFPKSQRSH